MLLIKIRNLVTSLKLELQKGENKNSYNIFKSIVDLTYSP